MHTGDVVWITGASSGIGEALAVACAQKKAKLILSARRTDELERVRQACLRHTDAVEILAFDLADTEHIEEYARRAESFYGAIDFLMNNGGIGQRSLAKETAVSIDRKIMEINYFANITLAKAVLPGMLKRKKGHITVISSLSGKFGFPMRSAYAASKFALHGFYESLRAENANDGIEVLLVCPGRIKTNISVHALNASGGQHGHMDKGQANGISAEKCARIILRAIDHHKKEIIIARKERILLFARKYFPGIFYYLSTRVDPNK